MNIQFTPAAWEEFEYWQDTDTDILDKIRTLIKDIQRSPFKGIGKPEPLNGELSSFWSRRITQEHRLVYRIAEKGTSQVCQIIQCKFHYDD
ncbi:MAG: Txe/YoeB family addiction module toxin [Chitinophagaceae bacterium]|nr:MAG: Txe/YoeB family addiction module toxin [Chitinophagaceae bacterium]